jgi:hypothetical protein
MCLKPPSPLPPLLSVTLGSGEASFPHHPHRIIYKDLLNLFFKTHLNPAASLDLQFPSLLPHIIVCGTYVRMLVYLYQYHLGA